MHKAKTIFLAILCVSFNHLAYSCQGEFTSDSSTPRATAICNKKDVIAFVAHAQGELQIEGAGLNDSVRSTVNAKLKEQDYITVLRHIWTEPDYNERKDWLTEKVKEGHPILMFELAKVLVKENAIEEGLIWLNMGLMRATQDAYCCDDISIQNRNVPTMLAQAYARFFSSYSGMMKATAKEALKRLGEHQQQYPSPQWVGYHGLSAFSGNVLLVSESEWPKIRSDVLQMFDPEPKHDQEPKKADEELKKQSVQEKKLDQEEQAKAFDQEEKPFVEKNKTSDHGLEKTGKGHSAKVTLMFIKANIAPIIAVIGISGSLYYIWNKYLKSNK